MKMWGETNRFLLGKQSKNTMPFTKKGKRRGWQEEWMGDDFSRPSRIWVPKAPRCTDAHPVDNYASFIWNSRRGIWARNSWNASTPGKRLTWEMCAVTRRPRLESGHHRRIFIFYFSSVSGLFNNMIQNELVVNPLKSCQTPWIIAYQVSPSILYYSIQWLNLLEFSYL